MAKGNSKLGATNQPQTLAELKVGDTAYIRTTTGAGQDKYREVKVEKVTATQITTSDGARWFKDNGDKYGERGKARGTFEFLKATKNPEEKNVKAKSNSVKLVRNFRGYKTEDGKFSIDVTNGKIKGLHPKYSVWKGREHKYARTLKEAKELIKKWED